MIHVARVAQISHSHLGKRKTAPIPVILKGKFWARAPALKGGYPWLAGIDCARCAGLPCASLRVARPAFARRASIPLPQPDTEKPAQGGLGVSLSVWRALNSGGIAVALCASELTAAPFG